MKFCRVFGGKLKFLELYVLENTCFLSLEVTITQPQVVDLLHPKFQLTSLYYEIQIPAPSRAPARGYGASNNP